MANRSPPKTKSRLLAAFDNSPSLQVNDPNSRTVDDGKDVGRGTKRSLDSPPSASGSKRRASGLSSPAVESSPPRIASSSLLYICLRSLTSPFSN
jgi:hypothetical protein